MRHRTVKRSVLLVTCALLVLVMISVLRPVHLRWGGMGSKSLTFEDGTASYRFTVDEGWGSTTETDIGLPIWIAAALMALGYVWLVSRADRFEKPGACRQCGYMVGDLPQCPECGKDRAPPGEERSYLRRKLW